MIHRAFLTAACLALSPAGAYADARIEVTQPRTVTTAPAVGPPWCQAAVTASPASAPVPQAACSVNVLDPMLPDSNYSLTFQLRPRYPGIAFQGPIDVGLLIQKEHFRASHFSSFTIPLPEDVQTSGISYAIDRHLAQLCKGAAPDAPLLWSNVLWADMVRQHTASRLNNINAIDDRYLPGIERVLYLGCRGLLRHAVTRATVAGSIREGGLRQCQPLLTTVLGDQPDFRSDCRGRTSEPTIGAIAREQRRDLYADAVDEQQAAVGMVGRPLSITSARLKSLSEAIAADRDLSGTPTEYAALETRVIGALETAAVAQRQSLYTRVIAPDDVLTTRLLGDGLLKLRADPHGEVVYGDAGRAIVRLYDVTAQAQRQAILSAPQDIEARTRAARELSSGFDALSDAGVVGRFELRDAANSVRALRDAEQQITREMAPHD